MKTAIIWLHILNIVAGCAIGVGYDMKWIGFIVAATAGVGAYLSTLLSPPTK